MTTAEAAELLGVSVPAVLRMAKYGRIAPFHKIPGRTDPHTFHRDEVTRVLAERNLS
ncbi:MAG: helix-turn-helix domain-containing protein [Aeromicrobium sp.]|uniref:helix-turn-helix domain-containing protein n=1 Tax=Aeromicrobium sp. TaxID=1871063 RepID=UPI0039E49B69